VKSLENQRVVVEKANEEAGKLNALTWRLDSEIKHLQEGPFPIGKDRKEHHRIDAMFEESRASISEIRRFEKFMLQTTQKIEDIRTLDAQLDQKLQQFQKYSAHVDEVKERAHEVHTMARNTEAILNTLNKHSQMLEKTHSEVLDYERALDKIKVRIEEVGREWNTIDSFTQRIAGIESQMGAMDSRLDATLKKAKDVETAETKLQSVHALIEDTCAKEEQVYKYRAEIDKTKHRMDEFALNAAALEEKMVAVWTPRKRRSRPLRKKIDELKAISEKTGERINQAEEKARIIVEVEHKIENLGAMVADVDGRINAQLQRQAMIDKTEKRLDQLNYLLGDINMKIQGLTKDQKVVDDLTAQLSAISVQSQEAQNHGGAAVAGKTGAAFGRKQDHGNEKGVGGACFQNAAGLGRKPQGAGRFYRRNGAEPAALRADP